MYYMNVYSTYQNIHELLQWWIWRKKNPQWCGKKLSYRQAIMAHYVYTGTFLIHFNTQGNNHMYICIWLTTMYKRQDFLLFSTQNLTSTRYNTYESVFPSLWFVHEAMYGFIWFQWNLSKQIFTLDESCNFHLAQALSVGKHGYNHCNYSLNSIV